LGANKLASNAEQPLRKRSLSLAVWPSTSDGVGVLWSVKHDTLYITRMKLVIDAIPVNPSGGLTVLLGLLRGWRRNGRRMHITVLARSPNTIEQIQATGCVDRIEPVLVHAGAVKTFFWQNHSLGRFIQKLGADLLLTNNHYLHNIACPQVVHHHNLWRFQKPEGLETTRRSLGDAFRDWHADKALRLAAANVFVSQYLRNEAEKRNPSATERNYVVQNCLDDDMVDAAKRIPDRFDGRPHLMAIQSANVHKDIPTLLCTLAELVKRAGDVPWHLHVAGPIGRGNWGPFQQFAGELGVADRITWHGLCTQEQLDTLLRSSLCLVLTSLLEAGPLPPLEAMARRCPPVSSNVTAMPEFVGNAGLLVPPRRPEKFAEQVLRLYYEPALRDELVARGIQHIQPLRWSVGAEQMWGIFHQLSG